MARPGLAGRRPAAITGEAARARVHWPAGDQRCGPDRHRDRPGGRSAADLPAAWDGRALAGAGRARQRACACRSRAGSSRRARETPLWVVTGEAAPNERAEALQQRWRRGPAGVVVRWPARSCARVLQHLAERGITRLMVEAGPILAAAFLAADLVDEAIAVALAGLDRRATASMPWKGCRSRR